MNGNILKRCLCWLMLVAFVVTSVPSSYAQSVVSMPAPGTMVTPSTAFVPAILKGMKVYPKQPLRFDFIVDTGNSGLTGEALKPEVIKIVRYFLASLTTPEKDLWVNLSPYEGDRIIPDAFGQTEMGRDLLAEDYILKQLTSSLMYPENALGKEIWKKIYAAANEKYGTTDIPLDTFNKVWITPDEATVYVNGNAAVIKSSHLKVMLESDYFAMTQDPGQKALDTVSAPAVAASQEIARKVVREVVLPVIEKEVNEGANFALLRQIYQAMVLSTWFKRNLKESLIGKIYTDKNKVKGIDLADKDAKARIWQQYVDSFKKGVFNYIKEETDEVTGELIPRKYFSGGFRANSAGEHAVNVSGSDLATAATGEGPVVIADINLDRGTPSSAQPAMASDAGSAMKEDRSDLNAPANGMASPEVRANRISLLGQGVRRRAWKTIKRSTMTMVALGVLAGVDWRFSNGEVEMGALMRTGVIGAIVERPDSWKGKSSLRDELSKGTEGLSPDDAAFIDEVARRISDAVERDEPARKVLMDLKVMMDQSPSLLEQNQNMYDNVSKDDFDPEKYSFPRRFVAMKVAYVQWASLIDLGFDEDKAREIMDGFLDNTFLAFPTEGADESLLDMPAAFNEMAYLGITYYSGKNVWHMMLKTTEFPVFVAVHESVHYLRFSLGLVPERADMAFLLASSWPSYLTHTTELAPVAFTASSPAVLHARLRPFLERADGTTRTWAEDRKEILKRYTFYREVAGDYDGPNEGAAMANEARARYGDAGGFLVRLYAWENENMDLGQMELATKVLKWISEKQGVRKLSGEIEKRIVAAVRAKTGEAGSLYHTSYAEINRLAEEIERDFSGGTGKIASSANNAMASGTENAADRNLKGGIDLNSKELNLSETGGKIDLSAAADPAVLDKQINGLTPVLFSLTPMTDPQGFFSSDS